MAFNITIVAFGKEPDISDEKLLDYRGFDPELVGKCTSGSLHFYKVKTEVPDCHILHVQTRDEHVASPNMSLVFENILTAEAEQDPEVLALFQERLHGVLKETMIRVSIHDPSQLEGPWQVDGVMAFMFMNVADEIQADLKLANSKWLREHI